MVLPLPLRFRGESDRVLVEADTGNEPLRDFFVRDLGENIRAIVGARGRLSDRAEAGTSRPWQARYQHHLLEYDGTVVRVQAGDGNACEVRPSVLDACLTEYSQLVGVALRRRMLERIKQGGGPRFVPDRELPVEFAIEGPGEIEVQVADQRTGGHLAGLLAARDPLLPGAVDWVLAELDKDDPAFTWPGHVYEVEVAGGAATISTLGGTHTSLDAEIFRQALGAYRQAFVDSFQAPDPPQVKPGMAVLMLALGGVTAPAWGWGLLQTSQAMLTELAGLAPHSDDCVPPGVMGRGQGVYWADLAVKDHETGRVWTGTKTFLPRRIDGVQIMTDLVTALMEKDATFIPGIPGAWSGVVAGVPGHGYLDPNGVGRLPLETHAVSEAATNIRAFFPVVGGSDPAAVAALVDGIEGVTGRRYVLTAFFLQDVQCHRHHLDVLRSAEPGWEHTGNACHLVRGTDSVRLEHLWLDGRDCELPVQEFHAALEAYEALLTEPEARPRPRPETPRSP